MEFYLDSLRTLARRHSRVPDEAEDLLQDALLEALRVGRGDLSRTVNYRWITGTIRNLGAMAARGAVRRRIREARWVEERADVTPPTEPPPSWLYHPAVDSLPPALRRVALLALSGHDRKEVAWLLGISDAALRRRISDLRKRLSAYDLPDTSREVSDLPLGLIRRALLPAVTRAGAPGVSDPDGHLILLTRTSRNIDSAPDAHTSESGGNILAQDQTSTPQPE